MIESSLSSEMAMKMSKVIAKLQCLVNFISLQFCRFNVTSVTGAMHFNGLTSKVLHEKVSKIEFSPHMSMESTSNTKSLESNVLEHKNQDLDFQNP